jgi:transcription elongation factor Elf1
MVTLTQQEVERRLGTVKCAICKESSFGIDERFMGTDGEWRGICKKCFYTFPVHTDMEFYLKTQPDVPYHLNEISCTACNHRGVNLDFRATLSVREAVYFVTCRGCKRQFPEKSSLEAFE